MAVGTGTALALGGAAVVGAGLNYLGSKGQADAARSASKAATKAGRQGSAILARSEEQARSDLTSGASRAQGYEQQAYDLLGQGRQDLQGVFGQERQVGSDALSRLQQVILGGDMSQLQLDPGYAFRLEEGNKAIQRAASAAGSFGGGRNLKDFDRFSQGLASQEYGSAIQRLMALQGIGSAANRNYAGLSTGLLQSQAGVLGNQGAYAASLGSNLANVGTTTAANRANALSGAQSNASNYNLQAANANAAGLNAVGSGMTQAALAYALFGGGGGGTAGGGNLSGQPQSIVKPLR